MKLRDTIRFASGENLDLKAYEECPISKGGKPTPPSIRLPFFT